MTKRIVVGISGASGVIYGVRLLEVLKSQGVETHLVMSPAAKVTIVAETKYTVPSVEKLATRVYKFSDITATISSGSFETDGMVIIPCSMHTLGALASGVTDSLLTRAADVTIKERRPMIVVPRETPLSLIHIENMKRLAEAGAIIVPAMPAFYIKPKSLEDLVDHLVGKVLDLLKLENSMFKRWEGMSAD
ncbi:MAG: UbiX family flavin prenyltransferase [Nitrososphaerota archaeon]|nr:UbiX family flavin prenyltransferase [Nitrososphaerota archaeon]MDG6923026.1 UbiX family flavin prenyltransferase [Nitrososphaerota archaeon]